MVWYCDDFSLGVLYVCHFLFCQIIDTQQFRFRKVSLGQFLIHFAMLIVLFERDINDLFNLLYIEVFPDSNFNNFNLI